MAFKNIFNKNSKEESNNTDNNKKSDKNAKTMSTLDTGFVLGVLGKHCIEGTDDVAVTGNLDGTVHIGDKVCVSCFGDDDDKILLTTVISIEKQKGVTSDSATDCGVILTLANARKHTVKCATVVYTENILYEKVHKAYYSALGDYYVASKKLILTAEEYESLSITDCYEIWRLFTWLNPKRKINDEKVIEHNEELIKLLAQETCRKLLCAQTLYCVFSKNTGEPYMFSETIDRQDGTYTCTPPEILIITKAYIKIYEKHFLNEKYEIREITNDKNNKGIENFLGPVFYMNGACGLRVNSEEVAVGASQLVAKPDMSSLPEIQRPVMNPNIERWFLLMGQIDKTDDKDLQLIYSLYDNFMLHELLTAKLLIPMKHDGSIEAPDENGKTVLKKDTTMTFPVLDGKYGRKAVRAYTDWNRLCAGIGDGWNGMITTVKEIIDVYDLAINLTKYQKAGCYISKDVFEEIENKKS